MRVSLLIFLLFGLPALAVAQVEITEIMYNLEGSDANREWIEIQVSEDTNISGWKFYEAETNHRLSLVQGTDLILSNRYAVIARKSVNFLADYPDFSGTLLTSSFSLSNTGEILEIRTPEKEPVYSVNYSSEWGASGDGNSLQFYDEEWKACSPTPAESNVCEEVQEEIEETTEEVETPTEDEQVEEEVVEEEEVIEIEEEVETVKESKVIVYPKATVKEDKPLEVKSEEPSTMTSNSIYSKDSGNIKVGFFLLLLVSAVLNIGFLFFRR